MKLIQLNAWGGRLEHLIGDFIEKEKPDIICLQEAISFNGKGSGLFITIENIQKKYNLPYLAFEPVFSFKYMKGTARFGNCILSRFPIKETRAVFTHDQHQDDFMWGEDNSNTRNFVHAVVEDNSGKTYNVLTHHGFWIPDHKDGNDETMKSMDVLADYLDSLEGPTILTGDFNLSPSSKSLLRLNNNLENLCITHKLKTTRTPLTFKTEVCDYIFINDSVKVKSFYAEDEIISDHKALMLDFTI